MGKSLRQMFSGKDNASIDIARVMWFEAVNAFIMITIYFLYKGGTFDPISWGTGLAGILAAGGAAVGMKATSEPDAPLLPPVAPASNPAPPEIEIAASDDPYTPRQLGSDGFPKVITKADRERGL